MKQFLLIIILLTLFSNGYTFAQSLINETFPPLKDRNVSQTIEELWKDYDPKKEPLDTEILKEWMEDNVVMKVIRYRIGIFKGQKAMMAVCAEGEAVEGPVLQIGNTNSHYRFSVGVKRFMDEWSKQASAHNCVIGLGHITDKIVKFGRIIGIEVLKVC